MARGSRSIPASRSAAASRSTAARKASPASARLGRRADSARNSRATGGGPRGGGFSTRGPRPRTRQQLYQEAKARNIKGRSTMTKAELARALGA